MEGAISHDTRNSSLFVRQALITALQVSATNSITTWRSIRWTLFPQVIRTAALLAEVYPLQLAEPYSSVETTKLLKPFQTPSFCVT